MLLEKYRGNELSQYLNKIVQEVDLNKEYYNDEGKDVLIILIEKILIIKIGEEKAKEIVEILKGGNKDMLNCIESAYRENRVLFNNGVKSGMKTGIAQGKTEIIKELLKIKMPISQISQVTHFTEEEIKKIANNKIS